jgi:hypothetical protein
VEGHEDRGMERAVGERRRKAKRAIGCMASIQCWD